MLWHSENVFEIKTKAGREGKKKRGRVTEGERAREGGSAGGGSCQGFSSFSAEVFLVFDCLVFDYMYWIL